MRSYGQYCGLAQALDRVGDRWTLLIVRELLTGPKRFSDLERGLPGVATNLLANRLRRMELDGLVEQQALPPPAGSTAYVLTRVGESLDDVVHSMVRWGGRFMRKRSSDQAFQPHWLGVALQALLGRREGPEGTLPVAVELPEGAVWLELAREGVAVLPAPPPAGDVTVRGSAAVVLGLAAGELDWDTAAAKGLRVVGSAAGVAALRAALARAAPPLPSG